MLKALTLSALLACAPALQAADYTLFIFESADDFAARTDPKRAPAYWASYAAFAEDAGKAGVMRGGAGVEAEGAVVGGAAGFPKLGGYFVIDVPDLAAAKAWAAKLPAARTGRVEARPHMPVMAGAR